MPRKFEIKLTLPVLPKEVYRSWLNSEKHSQMTGGIAVISNQVGTKYSAWDDYITGKNLELIPNEKIVQSWRTSDFKETDEDSRLEIKLKKVQSGSEIILIHSNIPDGQPDYEQGWKEHYFEQMVKYFQTN